MKLIGLSYSRCLLDIYTGAVDYNDVLCIIARTRFDPENREQWETGIWNGYTTANRFSYPEWINHSDDKSKEELYELTRTINKDGKLHQPRNFGNNNPWRSPYQWMKCDVVTYDEIEEHNSTKYSENKIKPTDKISDEDLNKMLGLFL